MANNDTYYFNLISFISNLLTLIILISILIALYIAIVSVRNPLNRFINYITKNVTEIKNLNEKTYEKVEEIFLMKDK